MNTILTVYIDISFSDYRTRFLHIRDPYCFFSKSADGQVHVPVCQISYLPWQNYTCLLNAEEWQQNSMHVNGRFTFLLFSHSQSPRTHSAVHLQMQMQYRASAGEYYIISKVTCKSFSVF